jgi:hypothetical protein
MIPPAPSIQLPDQRKRELLAYFEADNGLQDKPTRLNAAFSDADRHFMRFLIPPGKRVFELGCGSGDLLAALEPSYGVGVDFSLRAITTSEGAARVDPIDAIPGLENLVQIPLSGSMTRLTASRREWHYLSSSLVLT